jgi:hypothetical protein
VDAYCRDLFATLDVVMGVVMDVVMGVVMDLVMDVVMDVVVALDDSELLKAMDYVQHSALLVC